MPPHDIRPLVHAIWEEFWNAGLADPADIIEQMLTLLFLRRRDDAQVRAAARGPLWTPDSSDDQRMRWSRFKDLGDREMHALLADHVYPRLRCLGGPGAAYAQLMKGARFILPGEAVLGRVVGMIEALPRQAGPAGTCAAYDYLSARLVRLGRRGASHTPPAVVRMMVALLAPQPGDTVCSPAAGACDFLVAVGDHLLRHHPALLDDPVERAHFHHHMFHAHDADRRLLRIGCMNMALLGVANPDLRYAAGSEPGGALGEGGYSVVLAHASAACMAGTTNSAMASGRAELRMVARCLDLLAPGGRAAIIVPRHILRGGSAAHRALRRRLAREQRLDGVIALPEDLAGAPAGRAKTLLLLTRTGRGESDHGWFHAVRSGRPAPGAGLPPSLYAGWPGARPAAGAGAGRAG